MPFPLTRMMAVPYAEEDSHPLHFQKGGEHALRIEAGVSIIPFPLRRMMAIPSTCREGTHLPLMKRSMIIPCALWRRVVNLRMEGMATPFRLRGRWPAPSH